MGRLTRALSAALIAAAATWPSAALAQPAAKPVPRRTPDLQSARLVLGGAINGVVMDERGGPVTGAMVTVNGATVGMTVSDSQGRFSIEKLPAGEYVLRAHLTGFAASPRQIVQVSTSSATTHRLQLRHLDAAVGTAGPADGRPIESRPIVAAGFGLPRPEGEQTAAEGETASADHPHTDVAWRLRHLKRSILKDSANTIVVAQADDAIGGSSLFERAVTSAGSAAAALFTDVPFSGEVNLLTTGAFGPDVWSGSGVPRGVAYFSIGAPTPAGDWLMRAAMSEGDLSSWVIAGSFLSRRNATHTYDLGLSYSTQEYAGGNPVALAAVKDGSRNVGEVYAFDSWAVSPALTVDYGGRYARYDYLVDRGLLSPRAGMTLEPVKGTRIKAVLAQRMVAPGAEEFLSRGVTGPWLPPERTFAPLGAGDVLRVERARYVDVLVEHEFEDTYVIGLRRFFQEVDNQLATLFGVTLPDGPRSLGHYYVASAGSVNADGWGVRVSSPSDKKVRASVDYSVTHARWTQRDNVEPIARWAPAAIRPESEDIHDLTTSVETDIPGTATRVFLLYKLNSAFTRTNPTLPDAGLDGRFDLQVNQALPFDVAGTRWEVLFGLRNLFRDPRDPASIYDELLVVRPPKRVIGGFLVRF